MRAALCTEFGPPESLVVREVDDPVPGTGQVVVDMHACGVNFPDYLMIQDMYQFKPALPFSPGGEISGVVSAVGPDVDRLVVGDRVVCSVGWGGMAERVVVPEASAIQVPVGVDMTAAAAFLVAHGTAHYALKDRADLRSGETLLVLGAAGGVGLAAVELGALAGARVIAAASTDEKLDLCREYGATDVINYTTEDLRGRLKELTGQHGVDVCYDPVGGALAEPALRSMAWRGRYLVIGFAAGDIPRIPLNLPLLKGCSIVGVFWGSFALRERDEQRRNTEELWALFESGRLVPVVGETHRLEDYAAAFDSLATRRAQGKVVVLP
ncbi:MAG TPA: NADPH:quinone oxidoreductase family protein [Ilumatobacteraceae bacterium]|nr:NADPH:quinone oxidoreductase family protein [Ilumatobacteraceae bacterium]